MNISRFRTLLAVSAAVAVAGAGCGGGEAVVTAGSDGAIGCGGGVQPIVDLLAEGIPAYDYDPFDSLEELIEASDEIVVGTLRSAQRIPVESGDGSERWVTRVEPAEASSIKSTAEPFTEPFSYDSFWGRQDESDPLGRPVVFDEPQVRFVAFLNHGGPVFSPHIQGFAVGCHEGEPAAPVVDPIPGAQGMTIEELALTVAIEAGTTTANGSTATGDVVTIPHRLAVEDLDYGSPYTTRRLTAEEVWAVAPDFELDPDSEVFFEFNIPESGGCDAGRLERIEYNAATGRVYPVLQGAEAERSCRLDARPHVVIVAIVRQDLPDAPLTLWVGPGDPIDDIPDDAIATFERGELRAPTGGDLEHRVIGESDSLAVGETGIILDASTHCGLERLFHLVDGRQWLLTDESADTGIPASWRDVTRGENIDLVVERTATDQLIVAARGTTDPLTYRPAPDLEGCD